MMADVIRGEMETAAVCHALHTSSLHTLFVHLRGKEQQESGG